MEEQCVMTTEELRSLIHNLDPQQRDVDNDMLIWFVCRQEAEAWSDYNTRELANIILKGLQPTTFEDVQDWLDRFFEDNDDEEECQQLLISIIKRFNGVEDEE